MTAGEAERRPLDGAPWAHPWTGGQATHCTVLIMDGFRSPDGLDVWALCGHRWNIYGYAVDNMLRYSHCRICDQTGGKSHLPIIVRTLTSQELRRIRRRYEGRLNGADVGHECTLRQKAAWTRRQDALVRELVRRGRS